MAAAMRNSAYDAVVMGGGVVGSSIAFHLSSMGLKNILVIERDPCYKRASAMLSAGGIRQQFSVPENVQMSKYGIEFLKNPSLLQVTQGPVLDKEPPDFQFRENGYLFLSGSKDGQRMLEENNVMQRKYGVTWTQMMGPTAMRQRFPWLQVNDLTGGCFGAQNEGYFDPWSLLSALKSKAISQGVTYREGTVLGAKISDRSNKLEVESVYIKSCLGAKTTEQEVRAPMFINACGPWAGKLMDSFAASVPGGKGGPEWVPRLPVKARKRSIFMVQCKTSNSGAEVAEEALPAPTVSPLVVDPSGIWFRSEGSDGSFLVGMSPLDNTFPFLASEECTPELAKLLTHDPDCENDDAILHADHDLFEAYLWPQLYQRVPAFAELKVKSAWAGFYEYNTFDQNAIIGRHPSFSNVMLCNGFSGHGLQQSPAAGRAVGELMNHGSFQTIDLRRFSFDRILNNAPIFEQGIV